MPFWLDLQCWSGGELSENAKIPNVIIPIANMPNAIIPNVLWYFCSIIRQQITSRYYPYVLTYLMAMAMPQGPVGLDMKLSQPNMGLNYPLVKSYM